MADGVRPAARCPYDYISTQVIAKEANLNAKWDVLVFPPVGRGAQQIVSGHADVAQPAAVEDDGADAEHREDRLHRRHAAGPRLDAGLVNLETFVRKGGVLIVADDTIGARRHVRPDAGPVGAARRRG